MNKFEEFIVKKYPNRSAKVLLHKLQDNDGTWFYAVNEVQDQSEAWQSRQAEVDELQEEYAETELYLRGQLTDRDSKIANLEYLLEQDKSLIPILNKKLEEKDKRIEVALERLGLAIEAEKDWAIIEAVKILRGEHD